MAVINTKNADKYKDEYGYIQATNDKDNVKMGSGNDTVYGNLGDDYISGGAGNDRLFGDDNSSTGGNDTIKGGKGNDYIVDYIGKNYLYGEDGDDTLEGSDNIRSGNLSYFDGGNGNDFITGSKESDTINGGAGNDSIIGNGGNDTINGGKGTNIIEISNKCDDNTRIVIKNGGGADYIKLDGFESNSVTKYIKSSNDLIFQLKKSDDKYIYLKLENYFKYGTKYSVKGILNAPSYAALTWDKRTEWADIIERFTDGEQYCTIGYLLSNGVTEIDSRGKTKGSAYPDSITGGDDYTYGNDTIEALQGDDTLYGGIGDDMLYGGDGNNVYQFEANQGKNVIYSNKYDSIKGYNDTIKLSDFTYTGTADQVLEFYNDNNNNLVIEYEKTQIFVNNYFKLNGNTSLQYIVDNAGNILRNTEGKKFDLRNNYELINSLVKGNVTAKNSTVGGEGFDILTASDTGSILDGKEENDKLYGGKGDDTFIIRANAGHDTIYSSKGLDTVDASSVALVSENTKFYRNGNDLVLYYGETDTYSDSITFYNYFKSKYDCTVNYNGVNTAKLSELLAQNTLHHYTDSSVKKNITGTVYSDSIGGTDFNDKINGGSGSNIIMTLSGNDTITVGNDNNNYINAGGGNNKITVGNGNNGLDSDGVRTGYESYGIYADDGNNTIKLGKGNNYVDTGDGNNKITAQNGISSITAGDGNNKISLKDGNNVIVTGSGANTITLGKGNNNILSGSGNNVIKVGNGNDTITAGDGDNKITLGLGNNTIITGNGNNTIKATNGENSLTVGDGNNTITLGLGNNIITTGAGNNVIKAGNGNDTVTAGNGNNNITLGNGNNQIVTGNGNDTIKSGNGTNIITGGLGNDILTIGSGTNIINLSQGDGYLTVNQSTAGTDNYNLLEIDTFDNLKFERDTNNALIISNAADKLVQINKYFKSSNLKDIQLSNTGETKSISEIATIVIDRSLEPKKQNISGTIFNDSITGSAYNDTIKSSEGDDTIVAGKGNDAITGGLGTTTIQYYAGDGNDTINMTAGEIININYYDENRKTQYNITDFKNKIFVKGNDVIIKFSDTDSITIKYLVNKDLAESVNFQAYYMNNHDEYLPSFYEDEQVKAVDLKSSYPYLADYSQTSTKSITGSMLTDSIVGNAQDNTIKAGKGNDIIVAALGNDKIYGENGNNTIYFNAGDGNDTVYSGTDKANGFNDTLNITTTYSFFSADDCTETGYNTNGRILASQTKNDLIIKYSDNDLITVSEYFKDISKSKFDALIVNDEEKTITDDIYIIYDNISSTDNLKIENTPMSSVIYCGGGNDTVAAGTGNNIVFGGAGNDSYIFSDTTNFDKLNQVTDTEGYDSLYLDFSHNDLYLYMDITASDPQAQVPEPPVDPLEPGDPVEPGEPGVGMMNEYEINSPDLYIMSRENYGDKSKGILIKSQYDQWDENYRIEIVRTNDGYYLDNIDLDYLKQYVGSYVIGHGGSCEYIINTGDETEIADLQQRFAECLWTDVNPYA